MKVERIVIETRRSSSLKEIVAEREAMAMNTQDKEREEKKEGKTIDNISHEDRRSADPLPTHTLHTPVHYGYWVTGKASRSCELPDSSRDNSRRAEPLQEYTLQGG